MWHITAWTAHLPLETSSSICLFILVGGNSILPVYNPQFSGSLLVTPWPLRDTPISCGSAFDLCPESDHLHPLLLLPSLSELLWKRACITTGLPNGILFFLTLDFLQLFSTEQSECSSSTCKNMICFFLFHSFFVNIKNVWTEIYWKRR